VDAPQDAPHAQLNNYAQIHVILGILNQQAAVLRVRLLNRALMVAEVNLRAEFVYKKNALLVLYSMAYAQLVLRMHPQAQACVRVILTQFGYKTHKLVKSVIIYVNYVLGLIILNAQRVLELIN